MRSAALRRLEAACRRAITLQPGNVEAHSNLGVALANLGRMQEAVSAYRCAIAAKPDFAGAYCNLADTLRLMGQLDASEAACRKALALVPDCPQAHTNLGNTLKALDRLGEAEAMLRRAITINPHNAEAYSGLGTVLMNMGKPDEAEASFRQAIAVKPDCAGAYTNLSLVLKEGGRLTEAQQAAEEAVRLAPRKLSNFVNLGEVRRFKAGDPYMTALESLEKGKASLPIDDQVYLHFALAKAYADIGRPEHEFRQLLAGNALRRSRLAYDESAMLDKFDRVQAVFTPELVGTSHGRDRAPPIPIFIVGMPRSGSTLVEQILASHPRVFGGGELKLFEQATAAVRATLRSSPEFPEMALHMSREHFLALGQCYLAALKRLAPAATHITDKMPSIFF